MFKTKDIAVKFVIAETIAFAVILTGIGIYTNSNDPLFIHSSVNPFVVLSLSITLFYGLLGGLIFIGASLPAFYFLYSNFPVKFLLWNLLLILITGEFFFYWKKKIQLAEEESAYFKDKLRKQTNDFILLKLSHDQLERHYLIKPISIRSVLEEIKQNIIKDREMALKKLLDILNEAFNVEKGNFYFIKEDSFQEGAYIGKSEPLDAKDPLVKEAMETGKAVFISSTLEETRYLAVIPVFDPKNEDEIIAIFTIKKMPFRYLNADNILSINVALIWFIAELKKAETAKKLLKKIPYLPLEFAVEVETLRKLNLKFDIDSYIVIFKIEKEYFDLIDFIQRRIRGIDIAFYKKDEKTDSFLLYVLLPLSPLPSVEGFVKRIVREIKRQMGEEVIEKIGIKYLKVDEYIIDHLKAFEEKNVGNQDR